MLTMLKTIANKNVHVVSDPAPIIIGKGHMKMNTPKSDPSEANAATIRSTIPTKTTEKPKMNSIMSFRIMLGSFCVFVEDFLLNITVLHSSGYEIRHNHRHNKQY